MNNSSMEMVVYQIEDEPWYPAAKRAGFIGCTLEELGLRDEFSVAANIHAFESYNVDENIVENNDDTNQVRLDGENDDNGDENDNNNNEENNDNNNNNDDDNNDDENDENDDDDNDNNNNNNENDNNSNEENNNNNDDDDILYSCFSSSYSRRRWFVREVLRMKYKPCSERSDPNPENPMHWGDSPPLEQWTGQEPESDHADIPDGWD